MSNKRISELPYINNSKISGNTLVPLVTYFSATTGDTVHSYVSDLQKYVLSGQTITGGTYNSTTGRITFTNNSGGTFFVSGLTVFNGNVFTSGLTANTITTTNLQVTSGATSRYVLTSLDSSGNTQWVRSAYYNTLLSPTLTMDKTIGGIPQGTSVSDLTGKTIVDLLDDILFPTVLPTYTIPTISLAGATSSTVEVGNTIQLTLTPSSVKNDAGIFPTLIIQKNGSTILSSTAIASPATPVADQFGFVNPNNPNSGFTTNPLSETLVVPAPISINTSTTTSYVSGGAYFSGSPKPNNKGVMDTRPPSIRSVDAPQLSSLNLKSTTYTYTGIYPYFYGKSSTLPTLSTIADAISGGTATKVLSDASGTLTINFDAITEFLWFAHFTNYATKTKWYETEFNQGSIGGVSNLFGTRTINSQNSPDSYWSSVNYKVYISNYATNTTGPMQLRN